MTLVFVFWLATALLPLSRRFPFVLSAQFYELYPVCRVCYCLALPGRFCYFRISVTRLLSILVAYNRFGGLSYVPFGPSMLFEFPSFSIWVPSCVPGRVFPHVLAFGGVSFPVHFRVYCLHLCLILLASQLLGIPRLEIWFPFSEHSFLGALIWWVIILLVCWFGFRFIFCWLVDLIGLASLEFVSSFTHTTWVLTFLSWAHTPFRPLCCVSACAAFCPCSALRFCVSALKQSSCTSSLLSGPLPAACYFQMYFVPSDQPLVVTCLHTLPQLLPALPARSLRFPLRCCCPNLPAAGHHQDLASSWTAPAVQLKHSVSLGCTPLNICAPLNASSVECNCPLCISMLAWQVVLWHWQGGMPPFL